MLAIVTGTSTPSSVADPPVAALTDAKLTPRVAPPSRATRATTTNRLEMSIAQTLPGWSQVSQSPRTQPYQQSGPFSRSADTDTRSGSRRASARWTRPWARDHATVPPPHRRDRPDTTQRLSRQRIGRRD